MMPILHSPGVITPGQFGPTRRERVPLRPRFTRTMSSTGMPSVMQTISGIPLSARLEDRVGGEGRRNVDHGRIGVGPGDRLFHRVEHRQVEMARAALPGVTPPTILVP